VYWDGGPKAIECFMAHHLKECQNNVICNVLQLRTVEFEDSDSDEPSTSNHLVHSKTVSPRKYSTRSQDCHGGAKPNPLCIGE